MQQKFVAAQKNVVKTETQQTFVNGLLGFITEHYTPLEAHCVLLTIIAWVAIDMEQLYLLLINILLGSFQLFAYWSASLWGWNNPRSAVSASRGLHYPPEAWWLHALTDRLLWCATDDDQRQHHHAEHRFSFSIMLFVYFAWRSNITLTHLHVSNCRVRQLQFSGIFYSRWAL